MNIQTPLKHFLSALMAAGLAAGAQAAESSTDFKRPAYNIHQRFTEDWSGLKGRDTSQTGDWLDPLKFIPLSEDQEFWLSIGGHYRMRAEGWSNFGSNSKNNASYVYDRFTLHTDLHLGPNVRIFLEGISAQVTERDLPGGRRSIDADEADLQNAFLDVKLPIFDTSASLTLRVGRHELLFGKQRLVSPLDWANSRRTWDGISAILKIEDWTITGFATHYVPNQKYGFNNQDQNTQFYGVYASGKLPVIPVIDAKPNLELFWFGFNSQTTAFAGSPYASYNGTAGREERHTFGGRVLTEIAKTRFDFETEGAYQTGRVGSGDVDAYFAVVEVGYKPDLPGTPRVALGFDYASGDHNPGGDVQTFNPMFPFGHFFFGYVDAVSRQNIMDFYQELTFKPIDKLSVIVQGHLFWRAQEADHLYNAGMGVYRADSAANQEKHVGSEIDLWLRYQFDTHLQLQFGYSHLFAGDFINSSGTGQGTDFIFGAMQFTF